ncbi:MAG: branched-chain amino acid ABC transporter permease [Rhodospirillales bacterium]|nr:branched-chain amino acid ABC transporter permease [Rhodospirillales bacterium]
MDVLPYILVTAVTVGAMYSLATLGLSLVWGAMGMLNMAHGTMLTLGGYAAYSAVTTLGLPWYFGFVAAILLGALVGAILYYGLVRFMLRNPAFETNIIIATVGIAIALENLVLKIYGGQPLGQPVSLHGTLRLGVVPVQTQNILIVVMSVTIMVLVAWTLKTSRVGRAIRATAQNREAAQLMGVPIRKVYLKVLAISGALAGVSGVLLSSLTQLSPPLGNDPMLKAFIMCVVAGLGNLPGSVLAAFVLALVEACTQFYLGARWGFPVLLILVILALIWRPYGVFGRTQVTRL